MFDHMRSGLLGVLVVMSSCLGGMTTVPAWGSTPLPRGQYGPEDAQGDLAEFLVAQQLVVRGHLVSITPVERTRIGGCGWGARGPYESWDIEVAIDSVLFGVADDSTITITTVARGHYPPGVFVPGREVLAWGFHNCTDGWRVFGDALAVDGDGLLLQGTSAQSRNMLKTPTGSIRPTLDQVLQRLATASEANGTHLLAGSSGVALARIASVVAAAEGLVCAIDSTVTVFGAGESAVTQLTFAWRNGCLYEAKIGDWCLIPTGNEGALTLDACPYTAIARDNYARALGVPVDQLAYVLSLGPSGVTVRNVMEE